MSLPIATRLGFFSSLEKIEVSFLTFLIHVRLFLTQAQNTYTPTPSSLLNILGLKKKTLSPEDSHYAKNLIFFSWDIYQSVIQGCIPQFFPCRKNVTHTYTHSITFPCSEWISKSAQLLEHSIGLPE